MSQHTPGGAAGDYVLGTNDAEVERLGLQHRVWRPMMLASWDGAGLGAGARVIDVGAGPGYAALDLARRVGPEGHVLAVERSPRFAALLEEAQRRHAIAQLEVRQADLMTEPALGGGFDFAWCRWVACFVSSPETLVRWLARTLRPGGRVVFHEYAAYETWRLLPPRTEIEQFAGEVMASWRAQGGEPNIAGPLTGLLAAHGFRVVAAEPHAFTAVPGDPFWEWPASFVETNLARLVELGRVDAAWAASVASALREAERDGHSRMLTPLVMEIIAERE